MEFVFDTEFLIFFNPFHHNTVNISIIYTNLIALFAAAIYNIYNIYSAKERFNGLYDSERSSEKNGKSLHAGCRCFVHRGKYRALFGSGSLGQYLRMR